MKTFNKLVIGDFIYTLSVSRSLVKLTLTIERVKEICQLEMYDYMHNRMMNTGVTSIRLTTSVINITENVNDKCHAFVNNCVICTTPDELIKSLQQEFRLKKAGYMTAVKHRRYDHSTQNLIQNKWKKFINTVREQLFLNEEVELSINNMDNFYAKISKRYITDERHQNI